MDEETQNWTRLSTRENATSYQNHKRVYDQFHGENIVSARQIPPNRRSLTGLVPSRKNDQMVPFESALERDWVTLLEFDEYVERYEAQPFQLAYSGPDGRKRIGYPDFLAYFREDFKMRPLLVDVKYRKEIFERWPELKPRLRAAKAYAQERGWDYRIKTEVEIRTPYLNNAKFLLPYKRGAPDFDHATLLQTRLLEMETATPQLLLEACCANLWNRAQIIPTLWSLLAGGDIMADLDQPLTMNSLIWAPRVHP